MRLPAATCPARPDAKLDKDATDTGGDGRGALVFWGRERAAIEQRDAEAFVPRGLNHRVAKHCAVIVGRAIGLVVHIVELAHRHHTGLAQLPVRAPRHNVD